MGEVIDLMKRRNSETTSAGTIDPFRESNDRMRRTELRCFLRGIDLVKSLTDPSRERIAQRLWEILQDVQERHKITRTTVANFVWPNDHGTALKRLDKLTLVPGQPVSDKKRARLQKRPILYLRVAHAAAKLAGLETDAFTVSLFRETIVAKAAEKFLTASHSTTDDQEDWADMISTLLNEMGESVIARTHFPSHVRRIMENSGRYSLITQKIYPSRNNLLPHGGLAWNFDNVDEFPPIPSIPLFRDLRVPEFERTLFIGPDPVDAESIRGPAYNTFTRNVASCHEQFRAPEEKGWRSLVVNVAASREVRLALGPIDTGRPSVLFELRTVFSLSHQGQSISLLNPWLYDSAGQVTGILGNDDRILPGVIDLSWPQQGDTLFVLDANNSQPPARIPLEGEDPDGGSLQMEHCYAIWVPITAMTCRTLLEENATAFGGNVIARTLNSGFEWQGAIPPDIGPTVAPVNTAASVVEQALVSADESASLYYQLLNETKKMMQIVSERVADSRDEALEKIEAARRSWDRTPEGVK